MQSTQKRNNGVTIAKAIAIILMVLGHSGAPAVIDHYFSIIRMPLFFMMSGYCFKDAYIIDGRKYLKRRVSGIYVPYIKWSLIFLLFHNLLCFVGLYNPSFSDSPDKDMPYSLSVMLVKAIQILFLMVGNDKLLGGYWFLHDLFWGSLLFYAFIKIFKNNRLIPFLLIVLAIMVSYLLSFFNCGEKSQVISRTVFASSFIATGYAYKVSDLHVENSWKYIICINIFIFVLTLFWHSRFQDCSWREIPLYALLAVPGAVSIYGLGQKIDSQRGKFRDFLIYIGGKTFNVLTWHMPALKVVSLIIIICYGLPYDNIAAFTIIGEYAAMGWNVVYLAFGVGIPVMGSYIYDKVRNAFLKKIN